MNIVVACDSFKGSLTALEVVITISKAIKTVDSSINIQSVPISDGGEGMLSALSTCIADIKRVHVSTLDPLGREITGYYLVLSDNVVVIELAVSSGIELLTSDELNPSKTSTYGTGILIRHAIEHGYTDFVLSIGGSATNDAGIGILNALGYRFYDENQNEITPNGENLLRISKIDVSQLHPGISHCRFRVACDVTNPLYGPHGAAFVFAPQKGASTSMVRLLDQGLRNWANVVECQFNYKLNEYYGAGAAGGVGATIQAFLHATYYSGIELFMKLIHFEHLISQTDLIITGEGAMDSQTLMGKAPLGILKIAQRHNIPVIALTGKVENIHELNKIGFQAVFPILSTPMSLNQAMDAQIAEQNLFNTTVQIMRIIAI